MPHSTTSYCWTEHLVEEIVSCQPHFTAPTSYETMCSGNGRKTSTTGVGPGLLRPAKQVGIESGWCTVWGKETRDRIKVLKMVSGDSRPLGSRALLLGATSLLFSVLASRKYLLCYNELSLLCPVTSPILLITLDYLCYFLVQGLSPSWRS